MGTETSTKGKGKNQRANRQDWTQQKIKMEEAALTGESVPVEKHAERLGDEHMPTGDRVNMAYQGIIATYGSFCRMVERPEDVYPEDIDATYQKGVLKLVLKKPRETEENPLCFRNNTDTKGS